MGQSFFDTMPPAPSRKRKSQDFTDADNSLLGKRKLEGSSEPQENKRYCLADTNTLESKKEEIIDLCKFFITTYFPGDDLLFAQKIYNVYEQINQNTFSSNVFVSQRALTLFNQITDAYNLAYAEATNQTSSFLQVRSAIAAFFKTIEQAHAELLNQSDILRSQSVSPFRGG